ncbi:MAG TPA: YjbE family putative metal transport protein [Azospirillaceae bacterium]|nr:YjbE family putative metal transport protein [Azospirillaceae bacterium]
MLIEELVALFQVILIDLVLAGDNAIVVAMAAAGVARDKRRMVIFWGIAAAVIMRIGFALITTQLLSIIGVMLAGGVLLLWVCWKLWREIREQKAQREGAATLEDVADGTADEGPVEGTKPVSVAIRQIVIADVSMSLDNVLAVAGAAQHHTWVLVVGLVLSVALMGVAASFIARLLERHHWIAYVGLAVITYVALAMIWDGGNQVWQFTGGAPAAVEAPAPQPAQ